MTMHYKFQQCSPFYSGWCLRFCSSTECWLLVASLRHGSQCKLCRRFELPWCSSGKVSTRPLVCKRHGYVLTVQKHRDSSVAVHWQSDRCWVCWSCSSSVLSWRRQSSFHYCSRRAWSRRLKTAQVPQLQYFFVVDVPVVQVHLGVQFWTRLSTCPSLCKDRVFSQWRCHRYSSSLVYVDIQFCISDGYDVSSNFAYGGDDGLLDAFCVIFRAPPAMPELSASFSSPRR